MLYDLEFAALMVRFVLLRLLAFCGLSFDFCLYVMVTYIVFRGLLVGFDLGFGCLDRNFWFGIRWLRCCFVVLDRFDLVFWVVVFLLSLFVWCLMF